MQFYNIIVFGLTVAGCYCSVCPPGWSLFNRNCYIYSADTKLWTEAETECGSYDGHLADINSAAENTFLVNVMANVSTYFARPAWIGLNDRVTNDNHVWVSSNDTPIFTNWGTDEPNDVAGTQGCVQMYHTGLWNDMRCSYSRNYICKRPVNEVCPEGWTAFNRRCYKYSDTAKTWNTSQAACMADGGGLAEITSSDVNLFLVTIRVGSTIADAWIGLRLVDDQHTWLPSGNVATYFNWAPGEPNNHQSSENCIEMYQDGKWNDHNCENARRFFCEKLPTVLPYE